MGAKLARVRNKGQTPYPKPPLFPIHTIMRICETWQRAALVLILTFSAAGADAQIFESVGPRAQGMGGAFVGVADDASAAWWNPAGLASGAFFNVLIEKGRVTQPEEVVGDAPALRNSASGFAAAFPALGLSYYRLQLSQIAPISPTEGGPGSRQQQEGDLRLLTRAVSQFGMTVGQSIGDHLVLGSTVKLLRAGVASGALPASGDLLDAADDLGIERNTKFDLDLGAMARFGAAQLGLTVRNLTRPTFGGDNDRATLVRQVRTGIGLLLAQRGAFEALTLAADADLTTTPSIFGDVRHVATGAEAWLWGRKVGLRGGVTANTIGARRPSVSTGVSVAPIRGIYIEASGTAGADAGLRGWTTALRFSF